MAKINQQTQPVAKKKIDITKFEDLEGKFLLVKVGSDDRPATESDLTDVQERLSQLFEDNGIDCIAFVTHHLVSMEIVEKAMKESKELESAK